LKKTEKVYFPGLNALRFIAASAVIITHIELLKGLFGLKSFWLNPLLYNLGGLGVYFFFVLSGFLITYLLLKEKTLLNEIKIKDFYIRRILRIWPLYFFILILGFFVLPFFKEIHISNLEISFQQHFYPNLLLYLFILPNLAFSFYAAVPHIGQSWSIGVEEQFYIFWPWLIKRSDNILKTLFVFIVVIIVVKVLYLYLPVSLKTKDWYIPIKRFLAMTKLESMAIGGIGAYFLFHNNLKILKFITHKLVFMLSFLFVFLLVYFTPQKLQDGIHIIYSVLFLIIIMNISSGKFWLISFLDNSIFNYLGNISYGIYMYHFMIIPMVLFFYEKIDIQVGIVTENILIYFVVFLFTIIISSISFFLFEIKFIKIKTKYTTINSSK
jgi:peptidoglycan/LPS O-acetylase OafA/YrhL